MPATELRKSGRISAFIRIDNKLFVNPILCQKAKTPEFKTARLEIEQYFAYTTTLLKASKNQDDVAWTIARKRLVLPEEHASALGYVSAGAHRNAIGPELGRRLLSRS